MARVYLGLGANLGNPEKQLQWAVHQLAQYAGLRVSAVSSLYQTVPYGLETQPDYLNAVIGVETEHSPRAILDLGMQLEAQIGRIRTKKFASRLLDIDLLLYNEMILSEPDLQIPHYDLAQRAFVLVPLTEIAPQVRHPVLGKTAAELLTQVSATGTRCVSLGPAWAKLSEE